MLALVEYDGDPFGEALTEIDSVPGAETLGERDVETVTRGEAETDWLELTDSMDAEGIEVAE